MTYQSRIEELIGQHIAEYQDGVSLKNKMAGYLHDPPPMPYGYLTAVYHPMNFQPPRNTRYRSSKFSRTLSNGVPRAISTELVNGYLLGIYNPDVKRTRYH